MPYLGCVSSLFLARALISLASLNSLLKRERARERRREKERKRTRVPRASSRVKARRVRARETKGVEWLRGCWLLLLGDEEGAGGGGGGGGGSGGVKRGSRGVRALAGRYFCACLVFNFSPPLALFFLALSPSSREQQRKLTLSPRHARGGRARGR